MNFLKRNAKVEISSNEDGFRGSWFAGTVVRRLNKTRVLVKYDTILEDELGGTKLTEVLDCIQLRPPPPREKNPVFKLMDDVDAFHQDGWWEGIITEVLSDGRFSVYFRPTKEQRKFRPSELRIHREWVDDEKWVPPLQFEQASATGKQVSEPVKQKSAAAVLQKVSKPVKQKPSKEISQQVSEPVKGKAVEWGFSKGAQVEVKTEDEAFEGAWIPATILKKSNNGYMVEYQTLRNDDNSGLLREEVDGSNIRPQPPASSVKLFNVNQKVDAMHNDCWWGGVITKELNDQTYAVYFNSTNDELNIKASNLRLQQEWINGEWVAPDPTKPKVVLKIE